MLRGGVTAFINMDNNMTTQLEAWEDVGIRGALAIQSVNRWVPKELMISEGKRLEKLEETISAWHGRGLQDVYIAPPRPSPARRSL